MTIFTKDGKGYRSCCKECDAERKKRMLDERRKFIWEYLLEHPCEVCGDNFPPHLSFHHTGIKKFGISDAVKNLKSLDEIKEEIKKTKVLCHNHHSELHFREQGRMEYLGKK